MATSTTSLGIPGFGGDLLTPDHGGYDAARAVFNSMIDRHPAMIAVCGTTDDVVEPAVEGIPGRAESSWSSSRLTSLGGASIDTGASRWLTPVPHAPAIWISTGGRPLVRSS